MERSQASRPTTFRVAKPSTRSTHNGTPSIRSTVVESKGQGAGGGIRTHTGFRPNRCEWLCVYQFRHTRYRGTLTGPVTATPCSQWIVPLAATTCSGKREDRKSVV